MPGKLAPPLYEDIMREFKRDLNRENALEKFIFSLESYNNSYKRPKTKAALEFIAKLICLYQEYYTPLPDDIDDKEYENSERFRRRLRAEGLMKNLQIDPSRSDEIYSGHLEEIKQKIAAIDAHTASAVPPSGESAVASDVEETEPEFKCEARVAGDSSNAMDVVEEEKKQEPIQTQEVSPSVPPPPPSSSSSSSLLTIDELANRKRPKYALGVQPIPESTVNFAKFNLLFSFPDGTTIGPINATNAYKMGLTFEYIDGRDDEDDEDENGQILVQVPLVHHERYIVELALEYHALHVAHSFTPPTAPLRVDGSWIHPAQQAFLDSISTKDIQPLLHFADHSTFNSLLGFLCGYIAQLVVTKSTEDICKMFGCPMLNKEEVDQIIKDNSWFNTANIGTADFSDTYA